MRTSCSRPNFPRLAPISLLAITAALPGCVRHSTESIRLGADTPVDAVEALGGLETGLDENAGLPRDEWPVHLVVAENDAVSRIPSFRGRTDTVRGTPRRDGEWPTTASAPAVGPDNGPMVREMFLAPFRAAIDMLALPFRAAAAHSGKP